jgi:molecular chaperone DnaJ
MAEKRDYYEVLGLSKSATDQDIKKAYRSLAKKFHPDVNKEKGADVKFKEVQEAYETLMDPQKRAAYDQFGHAGMDGAGGFGGQGFGGSGDFGDLNDIFGSFFGGGFGGQQTRRNPTGPRQGEDRLMRMNIEFMEAVTGKESSFTIEVDEQCSECMGTGAHSKDDVKVCPTCQGKGQVTQQQRTPFGVFQSNALCPDCKGTGKKIVNRCKKCNGSGHEHKKVTVDLKVPAGIASGQRLRVPHKGEKGANGGPNGDLFIEIIVAKHKNFIREGSNIFIQIPLSALDATLGTVVDVPTVYGDVELTIPPATQYGKQFRLRGKGMKELGSSNIGDQYVEVKIEVDDHLSKEEKELYEKLRQLKGKESIYERFKKSFK